MFQLHYIQKGMVSTTSIFPPPSGGIQTLNFNNVYPEHSLLNMQISEIRHHVFFNQCLNMKILLILLTGCSVQEQSKSTETELLWFRPA